MVESSRAAASVRRCIVCSSKRATPRVPIFADYRLMQVNPTVGTGSSSNGDRPQDGALVHRAGAPTWTSTFHFWARREPSLVRSILFEAKARGSSSTAGSFKASRACSSETGRRLYSSSDDVLGSVRSRSWRTPAARRLVETASLPRRTARTRYNSLTEPMSAI